MSPYPNAMNALRNQWAISHWASMRSHGGELPLLQEDPGCLTDAGTQAFASTLAAAKPADHPTLEHLNLDFQPAIGADTAAALATAPFQRVSQLSLVHTGVLQVVSAERPCPLKGVCVKNFVAKPCLHTRVVLDAAALQTVFSTHV